MIRIQRPIWVVVLSTLLVSGCASVSRVSPSPSNTPTMTIIPPTSAATLNMKSQPTLTEVAKVPSITPNLSTTVSQSAWGTYTDPQLKVTLGYPASWQKDDPGIAIYSGTDGFFQLSTVGSGAPTANETCAEEMNANTRKGHWFGTTPKLEYLTIDGQAACLILPSEDQAEDQRGLSLLAI